MDGLASVDKKEVGIRTCIIVVLSLGDGSPDDMITRQNNILNIKLIIAQRVVFFINHYLIIMIIIITEP